MEVPYQCPRLSPFNWGKDLECSLSLMKVAVAMLNADAIVVLPKASGALRCERTTIRRAAVTVAGQNIEWKGA